MMLSRYSCSSTTSSPTWRSLGHPSNHPLYSPSLIYSDASSEDSEVRGHPPPPLTTLDTPSLSTITPSSFPPDAAQGEGENRANQASTQGMMAIGNDPLHVSDVMADALSHLNRVVEHLRTEGENEAANGIARDVHSMLDTFNHTTAPWSIEKFHMNSIPAAKAQLLPQNGNAGRAPARSNTSSTWAAVAATDIPSNNRLVKFGPSDGLKRHITEQASNNGQPREEDFRCIWIYGWSKDKPLSMVTERISTGAIFSMAYVEQYEAVCVIFQYAGAAMVFMNEEAEAVHDYGCGLFGKGHDVKYGEPYLENDDLARMQPPSNERRRLTFARQQLFTNGLTEERFRRDLTELVGRHNVELVWLFNTGNATAVFSSTVIARIVRDEFLRRSRRPGPYQEVQVGFSHDPCERPMNLITQIPYPGAGPRDRSNSGKSVSSCRSYNPNAAKFIPGAGLRARKGTDSDGWQTVQRRR
ncbi:hypothetical protein AYL99_09435 [Fonsecaea erecta]|uniref:Uncharacterized protein n=1 Tax=Fonsecaea erecta TaxID=1367422 RepID=A0A178Z9V9_9EURO|nr:hypothetical protein AYL99_09435 [Fonsecaea erecta]OAP56256.1 hypothetical protein AYL99_09435 [Fonsecaea erecta]